MGQVVGIDKAGKPIFQAPGCKNCSGFICGLSGSGKTTLLICFILMLIWAGERVLWLAFHGANDLSMLDPGIQEAYERARVRYSVESDIAIPWGEDDGSVNEYDATVIGQELAAAFKLSATQERSTTNAIRRLIAEGDFAQKGLDGLLDTLDGYDNCASVAAAAKMQRTLERIRFRDGNYLAEKQLVEVDLSQVEFSAQIPLVHLMLEAYFRKAQKDEFKEKGLTIIIDEGQNLCGSENSAFMNILKVGRKKGINMLIASSRNPWENKGLISQAYKACATTYIFNPERGLAQKIAREIAPRKRDVENITVDLKQLQRGEYIVNGDLVNEDGKKVEAPMKLCTPVEYVIQEAKRRKTAIINVPKHREGGQTDG